MEVLREEDDERSLSATSPQNQHQSSSSESRKNSSNFGVRTYIQAPAATSAGAGVDEDDGLLLDAGGQGGGRRASSIKANAAMSRSERLRNRWQAAGRRVWSRIRQFLYSYIVPVLYRILTIIRWQILLTIGCVTLCIGIVLVAVGMIYHDHQVLFPKDHEIQYLSVADWRLNRRFRALRSIGAILFGAGGGLALAALGISVLSRCKQRHDDEQQRQQQQHGDYDDDGMSSTTSTTATDRHRLFHATPSSSYQPIETSDNSSGPLHPPSITVATTNQAYGSTAAAGGGDRNTISFQLDSKQQSSLSSRRKSHGGNDNSEKRSGLLSKPRKSIQPHHQELPQFPTGSVKVEAVQMSRKAAE